MWQIDSDGRFSLDAGEFTHLIGPRTAAGFGRPWTEIADSFGLDSEGRILKAVASRATWSGIALNWPVDGGDGLPGGIIRTADVRSRAEVRGYRGFGVCRDLDGLTRLVALRRHDLFTDPPASQTFSRHHYRGSCSQGCHDRDGRTRPVAVGHQRN